MAENQEAQPQPKTSRFFREIRETAQKAARAAGADEKHADMIADITDSMGQQAVAAMRHFMGADGDKFKVSHGQRIMAAVLLASADKVDELRASPDWGAMEKENREMMNAAIQAAMANAGAVIGVLMGRGDIPVPVVPTDPKQFN